MSRIIRHISVVIGVLIVLKGCTLFAHGKNGQVTDASTGKPLEGVVVMRTWVYYAVPFSHSASFLAFDETVSDKNGKYHFPIKIRPFLSISFINTKEEMPLLFYKPGYLFSSNFLLMAVSTTTPDVALTRVPESYLERNEELEYAKKINGFYNYEATRLLKKAIAAEEIDIRGMKQNKTGHNNVSKTDAE